MAKGKAKDGQKKLADGPPPLAAGPGEVVVKARRAIVSGGLRTAPGAEAVIPAGLAESYGEKFVEVLRSGPAVKPGPKGSNEETGRTRKPE